MRSAQCYFCAVYAEKSLKVGECCKKAENLADFMTNGGKCEIGAKKGGGATELVRGNIADPICMTYSVHFKKNLFELNVCQVIFNFSSLSNHPLLSRLIWKP